MKYCGKGNFKGGVPLQNNAKKHLYFMGIGGIGMSGIAEIFLDYGYPVSGSDIRVSGVTERLQNKGAKIFIGQVAENITADIDVVVQSTAIRDDNPELIRAKEMGLHIVHRSQMLAELMVERKAICVAGAHGKTTTSSMIALMMELGKMDPTIVVGGEIAQIGSNAKSGNGDYLVAEADESDGSFLNLLPWMTVITNVEEDHLDHYKNLDEIRDVFARFVEKAGEQGIAVLNWDNAETRKLAEKARGTIISYGFEKDAMIQGQNKRQESGYNCVDVYHNHEFLGTLQLQVPGDHNLSNALAACAVGLQCGMPFALIADGLLQFSGAKRRFQLVGQVNNIQIIDDYAHHPTEIAATIAAARNVHEGRLVAVFQPHRYSRTKFLAEKFANAFPLADLVVITDVYSAGERISEGAQSDAIIQLMKQPVTYIPREQLNGYLLNMLRPGDMVLMMGAGNIWQNSMQLVEDLRHKSV